MKAFLRLLPILLTVPLAAAEAGPITLVRLGTHGEPGFFSSLQNTALLSDGRFATVWMEGSFGTTAFLQYVDRNGARVFQGRGVAVATSPLPGGEAAVIAHAREGVLVAVRRVLDGHEGRIVVQWIDGQGRPRWGAGSLAAPVPAGEDQSYPYLLASPDGGAFLCFVRHVLRLHTGIAVYCQRFSPEGRRLWGRGGAKTTRSPLFAEEPRAVAAADGGLLVFWRDFGRPDGPQNATILRGQRLGPDGSRRWGDDGTLISRTSIPNPSVIELRQFALVSDGSGGVILAYDDQLGRLPEGTDFNHVTAQRISSGGEKLWGEGVPVMPSRPPQFLDSLFPGPDGGAFVGVVRFPFLDYPGIHLVFQRLAADGRLLWPAGGVTPMDPALVKERDIDGPAFGAFDGNVLRIAWEHHPLGGFSSEILFAVLDPAGNRLTGSAGDPLTNARGYKGLRGLALDPQTGSSFVVWGGADVTIDSIPMGLVYAPPP